MPVWRLVFNEVATLREVEEAWSFSDIMKANAILDYNHDKEALNHDRPGTTD